MASNQRGGFNIPSGKMTLNGVTYTFPTTHPAGLLADPGSGNTGSGSLLWTPNDARNVIVNGDFSVFQIGNGPSPSTGGIRYADCWYGVSASAATFQHLQYTGAQQIGNNWATSMLQHACITGDASVAAGDFATINTPIEGYAAQSLMNGSALSFWISPPTTGTQTIALQNKAGTWVYLMEFAVTAGVWNYCTAVIPPFTSTVISGSNMTTNVGLWLYVNQMVGSTYGGTITGAWQNTAAFGTTNQTNWMATGGNNIYYYGFNLIPGQTPAPFIPHGYDYEIARCLRYRQIIIKYPMTLPVGQAISGTTINGGGRGLLVPMCGTPSATLSNVTHLVALSAGGSNITLNSLSFQFSPEAYYYSASVASGLVAGDAVTVYVNNGSGLVYAEAYPT